jgi:DNA-binding protein HU-beta
VNKSELIDAVAEKTGLPKSQAEGALNALIEVVEDTISNGDKIVLPGFGTWERRAYSAREARNPQTGEMIKVPAGQKPAFKPGQKFKDRVNGKK